MGCLALASHVSVSRLRHINSFALIRHSLASLISETMITVEATFTALMFNLICYSLDIFIDLDRVLCEIICLIKHLYGRLVVRWNEIWRFWLALVLIVHHFGLTVVLELSFLLETFLRGDEVQIGEIFTNFRVRVNVVSSFDSLQFLELSLKLTYLI